MDSWSAVGHSSTSHLAIYWHVAVQRSARLPVELCPRHAGLSVSIAGELLPLQDRQLVLLRSQE